MKKLIHIHLLSVMLKNFKFNSIFFRMLIIIFTSLTFMCIINFIGIKIMSRQAIDNEKRNSEFYLDYSYEYMGKLIQKIENFMYYLEYDDEIIQLRSMPADSSNEYAYIQNYQNVLNIKKKLLLFSATLGEISELYIYFPNIDRVLSAEGIYYPETYFNRSYDGSYQDWLDILSRKSIYSLGIWNFEPKQNKLSKLNLVKTFYEGDYPKCVLVANFIPGIIDAVFKGNQYAAQRKIFMMDNNKTILSSNTGETGMNLCDAYQIQETEFNWEHEISFQSDRYMVSYRYIEENKLYFVIMTPIDTIYYNIRKTTDVAYTFLAVMLITGLLLSVYISQRFYIPIGEILRKTRDNQTIKPEDEKCKNEYDSIMRNLNTVLSVSEDLRHVINDSAPYIMEIIITKYLRGEREANKALMLAKQYNIEFSKGAYRLIILKCSKTYGGFSQEVMSTIHAIIRKTMSKSLIHVSGINNTELVLVTYRSAGQNDEQFDLACVQELSRALNEAFEDLVFHAGCSPVFNAISEIKQAYVDSQCALEYRKVQDDSKVYFYNADALADVESFIVPAYFEERYHKALSYGNYSASETLIYDILDKNYTRNVSYHMYARMCNRVIDIMERMIADSGGKSMKRSVKFLKRIDSVLDINDMNDILIRNNKAICSEIVSRKPDLGMELIVNYINRDFCGNINLDIVADKFGYSPNYLSRAFKRVVGIGFQEYITRLRIERAKSLLKDSRKSINKIGEDVGYSNPSIFIKAFEKHEGLTPGKYRKLTDRTTEPSQ